ncbi:MAG TPA: FadR family transcriptional regulator [Candidatus Avisuccinivibrio pullicola]|nr:FadR family transcriptional regulator [Candidatus Avisuccinivibrio pullicola]
MDCVGSQYKAARSLPEIIADRIIDLILEQGLKEGDRLPNERELCVIMKVGRSSLREAVRMLSSRNILMVRHGSGIYLCNHPGLSDDPFGFTFIRDKAKLVNDVAEFRMMVEPRIASMAACNVTPEAVTALRRLETEVENKLQRGEPHGREDAAFHALIGKISGNLIIPKLEPILCNAINLFAKFSDRRLTPNTISEHRAIISAIEKGDSTLAHDEMIIHLANNRRYIAARLEMERDNSAGDPLGVIEDFALRPSAAVED